MFFKRNTFIQGEAIAQTCSVKKVFLEISQNSQENTCARVSFLIKLQAPFFHRTPLVAASVQGELQVKGYIKSKKDTKNCLEKNLRFCKTQIKQIFPNEPVTSSLSVSSPILVK